VQKKDNIIFDKSPVEKAYLYHVRRDYFSYFASKNNINEQFGNTVQRLIFVGETH
jgi:hypothetical protein